MRRLLVTLAVSLFTMTAFASDSQFSIFTSDLGYESAKTPTTRYSERTGGLGLALSHAFTPQWSVELKVADERHIGRTATAPPDSIIANIDRRAFHTVPVDFLTQYRFVNSSRWTPYVSGGVHYVHTPSGILRADRTEDVRSRTATEVGAGTLLRITPHFGLRFDANFLLGAHNVPYDAQFRPSFGVFWRF